MADPLLLQSAAISLNVFTHKLYCNLEVLKS